MKGKQISYEIVKGEDQPFADERDKKKFLDLLLEVKKTKGIKVLAFCITDDEGHFLLEAENGWKIKEAEKQLIEKYHFYYKEHYQKSCRHMTGEIKFQKEMTEKELLEYCLELHLIPMKRKLVKIPEAYWWCSFVDYRRKHCRQEIVNTEFLLKYLDPDRKQAIRKFVSLHHNTLITDEIEKNDAKQRK